MPHQGRQIRTSIYRRLAFYRIVREEYEGKWDQKEFLARVLPKIHQRSNLRHRGEHKDSPIFEYSTKKQIFQ